MCLAPRISRWALGKRSRSSFIAGSVRTKSPMAPPRITRMRFRSVARDSAREDRDAVEKNEAVSHAPPAVGSRTPIDLVAHEIRHRYPEQARHNQDVGENSHEQPAGFAAKKGGVQKRFGREQKKNAEGASRQEFVDKPQHEKKADRENEEQRFTERRKFSHFHRGEEPEAPEKGDRQQDESSHARPGQSSRRGLRRVRTDQSPKSEKQKD